MIVFRQSIGDGIVTFLIVQGMVIHVVCRNPSKRWKSIKHRKPIIREGIQCAVAPDGKVIMVVCNNRHGNGQEQIEDVDEPKGGTWDVGRP